MAFSFKFQSITFSDGTRVDAPPQGVVVLVGPNNAGKSATLRELASSVQSPHVPRRVTVDTPVEKGGDVEEFIEWLSQNAFVVDRADGRHFRRPHSALVNEATARNEWEQPHGYMPNSWGFLVFQATADARLGQVGAQVISTPRTTLRPTRFRPSSFVLSWRNTYPTSPMRPFESV